jgi:hypothetical protein
VQVGAGFQQVRGETVAEHVGINFLFNTGTVPILQTDYKRRNKRKTSICLLPRFARRCAWPVFFQGFLSRIAPSEYFAWIPAVTYRRRWCYEALP